MNPWQALALWASEEAVLGPGRASQDNFCFRGNGPAVFLLECSNLDVAFTLGWFTGLRLAVARVLGQNACKQRPAVSGFSDPCR